MMPETNELSLEYLSLVPQDKGLSPEQIAKLMERGHAESYTGDALQNIGMPVGGLCCGTVYLSGDGRLWLWDIFNKSKIGIVPEGATWMDKKLMPTNGSAYVCPPQAKDYREFEQRFEITIKTSEGIHHRTLDSDPQTGFSHVEFCGQYPIGTVEFSDPNCPVAVTLKAYSPFIPLNVADSSLPATILQYSVRNHSDVAVEVSVHGFLENAVMHDSAEGLLQRDLRTAVEEGMTYLHCTGEVRQPPMSTGRPDILFSDWSGETYEECGWSVEGEAFGQGPIYKDQAPIHHGDMGGDSDRVLNTSATSPGSTMHEHDLAKGKLTSRAFRIERAFVNTWISGGNYPGEIAVNVVIDNEVVSTITGVDNNRLLPRSMDVSAYMGREAILEVVDDSALGWGWIGLGRIWFSDEIVPSERIDNRPDYGDMGLALLGAPADFIAEDQQGHADDRLIGSLGRRLVLQADEEQGVDFVVSWFFPNIRNILEGGLRHYASRFSDAREVARYVGDHFKRLSKETMLWRDTWYHSTLPHWFLNRTFANTSVLATTTCHLFDDDRFWAWEGVGCCAGTCAHVWHYAQAPARLFPEIERNHREHIDFDLSLLANGVLLNRSEFRNERDHGDEYFVIDGQAGRILGVYREHQMSKDAAFLIRVWPNVKRAMRYIMERDEHRDGILKGPMHNTLDADWYGVVPWFCGLYHAALRACEAMAHIVEDEAFAIECRAILDLVAAQLDAKCWNNEYGYYVQLPDHQHPGEVGVYDGCHIDQVFGESWAWQVGLQGVMSRDKVKQALRSLWQYNFVPDVGPYREMNPRGRWYAVAGDGGLLMATHPYGNSYKVAEGKDATVGYFNECMSGFEHEVASHMIWEGMVGEGLAITKAIHDRYSGHKRNPYNEIECSDHYARSMASYGSFIAACGFTHNNPAGSIAFAPRIHPENFKAAFTAAEGWGTFTQVLEADRLLASIKLVWGNLSCRTLGLTWPCAASEPMTPKLQVEGFTGKVSVRKSGAELVIEFSDTVSLSAGGELKLTIY
ncbi:GH116 family glycosyl hydrolase [Coraliomargarita algicola]|uniref:GH116 family glycosyl hydrolase n=1 Tax=Coraliomargarita algicola TaxID=3092156 RepID=A0ABZ0RKD2_9BACT|nr:GH116 family glycosyl-hydrolase [Coraliomargarita sp. J2-16]WPJ95558.1 GH116 family glycosyl hydrolase [Coraliomargarita sp. J2-16]